jgi:SPP1 family predicted phage head-tail adaptor
VAQSSNIAAGKLRHLVQIVTPNSRQDTFGGTNVQDDSNLAELPAAVEALVGRELYAAQQINPEVTHKITIRYMDGIRAKMNVLFRGRFFQIEAPLDPDERQRMLILLCIERNA